MTYYIVFNEWNYPTESGREFVGDFDSSMDAEFAALSECSKEEHNFLKVNGSVAKGPMADEDMNCLGYILTPSESGLHHFFRSVIIEREV